jgi:hypothetical protein
VLLVGGSVLVRAVTAAEERGRVSNKKKKTFDTVYRAVECDDKMLKSNDRMYTEISAYLCFQA